LLDRIADLRLVASVQPNFVGEWGFPDGLYETRLGWERVSRMNPFGEIVRRGIPMAFGSDCMPFDPLYGVWSAVAHPIPDYRIVPYEAIRHYTQSAAYAAFEEALNDHRLKVGGFKARLRRLKGKRLKDGGFRPRAKLPTVGLKPPIGK
jgi:predicted amidohydrolase YtcJ